MIWKTISRLAKQSAAPLLIAIVYAVWVYVDRGDRARATDATTAFGGAFFFCMWILGQYFRTSKQLTDSEYFEKLSAGIEDINKSIRDLQTKYGGPPTRIDSMRAPSLEFMTRARILVRQGDVLPALLLAGLAFEHAIRAKADRMGFDLHKSSSIVQILQKIEEQLGAGAKNELKTLWKLRNQIVHANPGAAAELQNRPDLLDYFEGGIGMLGPERDPF
jgi:hypothetical protein